MLIKTFGSAVYGINATTITVETNITTGINFYMVGLPDNAVKESQQRIAAALSNNHYKLPGKAITINMAPADIRKEGSAYDLTIAMGILSASEQINIEQKVLSQYIIMGELSLDGELRPIKGALPIALQAKKEKLKGLVLPYSNAMEASVVEGIEILGAKDLNEVIDHFSGKIKISPSQFDTEQLFCSDQMNHEFDFSDVKGQESIKRALEVAAAGGHNVILIGPPGAGKTMLAKRLPTILPPLTLDEALETTKIHSVAGKLNKHKGLITTRPFRAPHHTISDVALVGGGGNPQPGEISLAHNGVLFLDELPEYKRHVLEVMRQPLEDRMVSISRARMAVDFPAGFMLIASMNPCPCGYYNHPEKNCVCPPGSVSKYLNRISGPLLDRIDIQIEVTPVPFNELSNKAISESSHEVRDRVIKARLIQSQRFERTENLYCNAQIRSSDLQKFCALDETGKEVLRTAMDKLGLSARAYDRILKVARTIADLESSESIMVAHIAEAIQMRSLDRSSWSN